MKCMHRPAKILSDPYVLDMEFRAARKIHHKILEFEDNFQKRLDRVTLLCVPNPPGSKRREDRPGGLLACSRILSKLAARKKRYERSSEEGWLPKPWPLLTERVKAKKDELRAIRNADARWKEALRWADSCDEGAPMRGKIRRQAGETDEKFEARAAKRQNQLSRRDFHRHELYEKHVASRKTTPEIHYDTWNALVASVDQAKGMVLKRRAMGLSAKWRHPKWDDPNTLVVTKKSFKIVAREKAWWTVEMRLGSTMCQFRAKFGNWHQIPEGAEFKVCQLTRRKNGNAWSYTASVTVAGMPSAKERFATTGHVTMDWGHREFGHDKAHLGLRVFTWRGSDGAKGEVLLPRKCRDLMDLKHETISYVDKRFEARKKTLLLKDHNRHAYRKRVRKLGVVDESTALWLRWETRYDRRLMAINKKIQNVRKDTYMESVSALRRSYKTVFIEDEKNWSHKKRAIEEMEPRRMRQNRDLSARYQFVMLCEHSGARVVKVPSKNSTRECPNCGNLDKNTAEILICCSACGEVRDKDYGACIVIERRGLAILEEEKKAQEEKTKKEALENCPVDV